MELILHQKQDLQLKMTFELRQAIELLQYSTSELEQYIKQQELENPLIELREKDEQPSNNDDLSKSSKSYNSKEAPIDIINYENINMRDSLFELAKLMFSDDYTRRLLKHLIYNLDDNGYLQEIDLNVFSEDEIEHGIHILQTVGPVGIGARNLNECLALQVQYSYPEEKLAIILIENYLDLVAERKWNKISTLMKIPLVEVKYLFDFIQSLNPRPCTFISDFSADYTTPDIIVEENNNQFVFHLNDHHLPSIHMNSDYSHHLHKKDELSSHIASYYKNYQWLISSIEQRRNTITKIMHVLLAKQHDFFKYGKQSLQPLTLSDVADEIEMHESTISRATINKVIQTPLGSFDLRVLFTSKVKTLDGESVSQSNVKALLQSFVAKENKQKPHSDQKIADYLTKEKGISISRRTISKYRDEMNIPSSSRRKDIQV
ncbi:RNA polymerase factor sigma-54 [Sporosarcina sp. CAU 1771]